MNIIGHSRNGRKLILNPVNRDMTDRIIRHPEEIMYTTVEMVFLGSIAVIKATRKPINIRATPSIIHSIAMIFRLSELISPKPRMIDFVGNR